MRSAERWMSSSERAMLNPTEFIRAIQADARAGEYERGFAEALEAAAAACDSWDAGSHFDKMSDAIRALKPTPPPRSPEEG